MLASLFTGEEEEGGNVLTATLLVRGTLCACQGAQEDGRECRRAPEACLLGSFHPMIPHHHNTLA